LVSARDFWDRSLRWFLRGRANVDLDFFNLVSFDSEEFRVPGVAAILGFAAVEDEGFVAFFKRLLDAIRLAISRYLGHILIHEKKLSLECQQYMHL
jgi:hypothetical protein